MLLAVFSAGCPGQQPKSWDDLKEPRQLIAEGKLAEALDAYANRYADPKVAQGAEPEAARARGEILLEVFKNGGHGFVARADAETRERLTKAIPALGDPSGIDLLGGAMEQLTEAISSSVEAELHVRCSEEIAWILRRKIVERELRRAGRTLEGFEEILYRRLLREAVVDYELYALARTPASSRSGEAAAKALEELAGEQGALAGYAGTTPAAAAYWGDLADKTVNRARQIRRRPEQYSLEGPTGAFAEATQAKKMKEATEKHGLAIHRLARSEAAGLVVEALEQALLYAFFLGESTAGATAGVADVLKIDLEQMQKQALKRP